MFKAKKHDTAADKMDKVVEDRIAKGKDVADVEFAPEVAPDEIPMETIADGGAPTDPVVVPLPAPVVEVAAPAHPLIVEAAAMADELALLCANGADLVGLAQLRDLRDRIAALR